ncbi:MAG: ACP S-malonyltransferase [Pseudomonadales bacterium]|nr:ACP S-malonyltransferase [Pseudomonadales bacterium]MCP5214975.1 ACP S-malonyltransferase [Pseudomonadales bacterium]
MNQKLAFVFPGQGSQFPGMLADLATQYSIIQTTFAEASEIMQRDLWQLAQEGSDADLNRTDLTQPLLLTASIALWRLWGEQGGQQPEFVSGHSLGEYSALVAAGAIEFGDAVGLVNKRGLFMQAAVPEGKGLMAAILGLEDETLVSVCAQASQGQVVSAVNFNAPGQVVIAGQVEAVERAIELCQAAGARRALPLSVSVPSHCALMRPAAEQLAQALSHITIKQPLIPVVQNVSAAALTDSELIKQALVEQLYRPVLWVDCVNTLTANGVERVIECGPGKVLTGLNKRINRQLELAAIGDLANFNAALLL